MGSYHDEDERIASNPIQSNRILDERKDYIPKTVAVLNAIQLTLSIFLSFSRFFFLKSSKTYSEIDATPDGRDLGEPQNIMGDETISQHDITDRIVLSQHYMSQQLREGKIDAELLHICKNKDELCTFWR